MTIYEQLVEALRGREGAMLSAKQIQSELVNRYGSNPTSVIPSDYCYNRRNKTLGDRNHLFVRVGSAEYRYIGPGYPYTGLVMARARGESEDRVVGEWAHGTYTSYADTSAEPSASRPAQERGKVAALPCRSDTLPLSTVQLDQLYEEYMRIVELEVGEFGCKATETRHLIGRLGELYCARFTRGQLARNVNQAGFDVVGEDGRRISVKTTAQRTGFVRLNAATLDRADDLMVLRFTDSAFELVYHGLMSAAVIVARPFDGWLELDLTRVRKLVQQSAMHPVDALVR